MYRYNDKTKTNKKFEDKEKEHSELRFLKKLKLFGVWNTPIFELNILRTIKMYHWFFFNEGKNNILFYFFYVCGISLLDNLFLDKISNKMNKINSL